MGQFIEFVGNHPFLFAALAATLVFIIFTEVQRATNGAKNISAQEATRMQNDDEALFLDVREANEFKAGHVLNAKHIPLSAVEKRAVELAKYKDKPIIAYCDSGMRSMRACATLKKQGFEKLFNLQGGMGSWERASLPVVTR